MGRYSAHDFLYNLKVERTIRPREGVIDREASFRGRCGLSYFSYCLCNVACGCIPARTLIVGWAGSGRCDHLSIEGGRDRKRFCAASIYAYYIGLALDQHDILLPALLVDVEDESFLGSPKDFSTRQRLPAHWRPIRAVQALGW
jgi:hypothetical protein